MSEFKNMIKNKFSGNEEDQISKQSPMEFVTDVKGKIHSIDISEGSLFLKIEVCPDYIPELKIGHELMMYPVRRVQKAPANVVQPINQQESFIHSDVQPRKDPAVLALMSKYKTEPEKEEIIYIPSNLDDRIEAIMQKGISEPEDIAVMIFGKEWHDEQFDEMIKSMKKIIEKTPPHLNDIGKIEAPEKISPVSPTLPAQDTAQESIPEGEMSEFKKHEAKWAAEGKIRAKCKKCGKRKVIKKDLMTCEDCLKRFAHES